MQEEHVWDRGWGIRFEKQSQGGQEQALRGAEEAEIADLDEPSGQNVLEEAVDELFSREGAELVLASIGRAVAKGDPVVFELDQAAVADGDPEDVRSEIFEGRAAIANRFAVDDPHLLPLVPAQVQVDCIRDIVGEVGLLEGLMEFGPEDSGESFDWEQKVMTGRQSSTMIV